MGRIASGLVVGRVKECGLVMAAVKPYAKAEMYQ